MSRPENPLHQPHDKLVKSTFSDPDNARAFLEADLPRKLARRIDWKSLTLVSGSFIDPEFAASSSDLLFTAKIDGLPAFLYILFEHQNQEDPLIGLRLLTVSERTAVIDLRTRVISERTAVIDLITRVVSGRTAVIDLITRVVSERTAVIDLRTRVISERTAVIDLITRVVSGRTAVIDLITRVVFETTAVMKIETPVLI